jgi:hypothetical protein
LNSTPSPMVTQAFLRGPRGHKALEVLRGDHRVPRELTIFDEQTREVEDFDLSIPTQSRLRKHSKGPGVTVR